MARGIAADRRRPERCRGRVFDRPRSASSPRSGSASTCRSASSCSPARSSRARTSICSSTPGRRCALEQRGRLPPCWSPAPTAGARGRRTAGWTGSRAIGLRRLGHLERRRPRRRAPGRHGLRLPFALRRLRAAGRRGDGLRRPGDGRQQLEPPRGRRRRRAALRPGRSRSSSPAASANGSSRRSYSAEARARGLERAAAFTWKRSAAEHAAGLSSRPSRSQRRGPRQVRR